VPSGIDIADLKAQMNDAYAAETAAALPLSEQMVRNASGALFSLTHPDHPWSAEVRAIAARIS